MARAKPYVSRSKERVRYVWHCTELDGSVTVGPGSEHLQWVYRREDGTEFVGLRYRWAVRRVDGRPTVDKACKKVRALTAAELFGRPIGDK